MTSRLRLRLEKWFKRRTRNRVRRLEAMAIEQQAAAIEQRRLLGQSETKIDGILNALDASGQFSAEHLRLLEAMAIEQQAAAIEQRRLLGQSETKIDGILNALDASGQFAAEHLRLLEAKIDEIHRNLEISGVSRRLARIDESAVEQTLHLRQLEAQVASLVSELDARSERLPADIIEQIETAIANVTVRISAPDRWDEYRRALHTIGVLNYQDDWLTGERRFVTLCLQQFSDAVVLDVGAHHGEYSQLVRSIAPRAKIYAFEPNPKAFAHLKPRAHQFDISAHQMALGETLGSMNLYDYKDQDGSQHASLYRDVIEKIHRGQAVSHRVKCKVLDSVVGELGIEHINLLKIDTEGHELSVLKGARRLIDAGQIDVIQFEFNEMNVVSRTFFRDFYEFLSGYKFYRLLSDDALSIDQYDPVLMEIFGFQNIACVRKDLDSNWIYSKARILK